MIRLDVVILDMALSQVVLALTCRSVVVWQWLPLDCMQCGAGSHADEMQIGSGYR